MRKRLSIAACTLLLSSPLFGQTQPVQMGITPTSMPEVLQVLDNTKTWVPIGTVDPTTHLFTVSGDAPSDGTLYGRKSAAWSHLIRNDITDWGAGVAAAVGVNVGTAGAPVVNGGALGTPSSANLANGTGLPLTGLASQAANTVAGNGTAGSASPTALPMPSCSTGASALTWTSGTGYGCNTITGPVLHPGYIAGSNYWYPLLGPGIVSIAGGALSANTVYCDPFSITVSVTIKALGGNVSTLFSGGFVGWAIYTNAANHRPGTLIDYAAPASTTTAVAVNGAVHNGTDTLQPGVYWVCQSADNATAAMVSPSGSGTISQLIGSTTQSSVTSAAQIILVSCLVSGTTCGTGGAGWGVWATGTFTWGSSFAGTTWVDGTAARGPWAAMQVN